MRLCVSILVAVVLTAVPASAVKKCDDDQLEVVVGNVNPNTYKVKFSIKNIGDKDVCVLVWETLLDPSYWPIALTLEEKDGNKWKLQDYASPVLPIRLDIDTSDYQCIKKNKKAEVTCDLSTYFSFTKNKQYQVRVETTIQDCYKSDRPGECSIANAVKDFYGPDYANYDVTKSFTAGVTKSLAKVTTEQWLETIDGKRYKKDGTVITFGATQNQLKTSLPIIKAAHTKAWQYFEKAVELLGDVPGEVKDGGMKLDIYETWFGSYTEENYNKVLANFRACLGEKDKFYIYAVASKKVSDRDDYRAMVLNSLSGKKRHLIYIFPVFFDDDAEDQALTVTHETTHDTANTEDVEYKNLNCYDEDDCKTIAIEKPSLAIKNADNYARFAEAAYKYSMGRKRKREEESESSGKK